MAKRWTTKETFIAMSNFSHEGKSVEDISKMIDRTPCAIEAKLSSLGYFASFSDGKLDMQLAEIGVEQGEGLWLVGDEKKRYISLHHLLLQKKELGLDHLSLSEFLDQYENTTTKESNMKSINENGEWMVEGRIGEVQVRPEFRGKSEGDSVSLGRFKRVYPLITDISIFVVLKKDFLRETKRGKEMFSLEVEDIISGKKYTVTEIAHKRYPLEVGLEALATITGSGRMSFLTTVGSFSDIKSSRVLKALETIDPSNIIGTPSPRVDNNSDNRDYSHLSKFISKSIEGFIRESENMDTTDVMHVLGRMKVNWYYKMAGSYDNYYSLSNDSRLDLRIQATLLINERLEQLGIVLKYRDD